MDEAALGEVAEELAVEEGTAEEGGMVALEFVLVAEVGVVEMECWEEWDDEVARIVFVEGGEVTCEVDGVGGCCWFWCC